MDGSFLRFYVHEDHRYHGHLVWEWLLEQANKLGIRGGSAFRAMAGFGRHRTLWRDQSRSSRPVAGDRSAAGVGMNGVTRS